jgi:hypothetical protein
LFIFGHLGFGSAIATPFVRDRKFPWKPFWIGCLLPDLIDKPLYYLGSSFIPWVTGTRTIGHSLLLEGVLALILGVAFRKPREGQALFAGALMHLGLDIIHDITQAWFGSGTQDWFPFLESRQWASVLFPIFGMNYFPIYPFKDGVREHLGVQLLFSRLAVEVIGFFLFLRQFLKLKK